MITKILFSNNSALKSHDSLSSQAQGSSQQAIISSEQILREFDLIEESENPQEELGKLISKHPSVLEDDYPNFGKLVFYAIEKDKLKTLELILEADPEVLNHQNPTYGNPVFYAINENNIKALELILEADPEVLNHQNPPYGSPVFYAIDKNNIKALELILEADPEVLNHQNPPYGNPVFYAIEKDKLKTLELILEADPEVLNHQNPPYGSPVFYAIDKNNIKALELILKANPEVLNHQNPPYGSPVFYAIDKNNIKALELILKANPEVLNHQNPTYGSPVFYAINENNIKALELILKANPEVLNHQNPPYGSPVFYAINENNIKALKLILEADPEVLNHQNPPYGSPVFYAIKNGKLASLKHILDHHPDELIKTIGGKDPFEFSLMKYLEAKQSGSQEEIDSEKSIINVIYQAQCKTKVDLDEEDFKRLEVFIKKFSHLKLGYSDETFATKDSLKKTIYQELLASRSSSLGESNDFDRFSETSLSTLKSIDNFESPIKTSQEKLYIFSSDLKDHFSYFVFHVNSSNNLTGISYCDGNDISSNQISIFNRAYLMGGVRKFKLNPEIKFSKEFVEGFLASNSKDKNMHEFYQQLSKDGLKVVDPEKPSSIQFLSISDNSKLDYEIPTKKQERGNCGLKSTNILSRYVAKLQNPKLSFSAGLNTPSSLMQLWSTQIDGRSLFKQFKGQFTISQVEDLLKLKQDLSEADQQKPFNQFLTQRIDKILLMVNQKAKKKIEKKQGIFKSKDLAIHRRIAQLTEGSTKTEIEEMPRASCFAGIFERLRFNSKKNKKDQSKPNSKCFGAMAKFFGYTGNKTRVFTENSI